MFFWNSQFFYDPRDAGNLISASSAFSKSSLNIWKFMVHVLLTPSLENFEHYFASMWDECNCAVVWTFLGIGMKTHLFRSCGHCWVFQICWHIECSSFTASSFWIWNSSTGIPSPPLVLVSNNPTFLKPAQTPNSEFHVCIWNLHFTVILKHNMNTKLTFP